MRDNLDRINPTWSASRAMPRPSARGSAAPSWWRWRRTTAARSISSRSQQRRRRAAGCSIPCSVRSRCSRRAAAATRAGLSMPSGTFRTICVRTCDGFYYPISAATSSARFAEDEKACRASCPATEVQLYSPIAIRAKASTKRCRSRPSSPTRRCRMRSAIAALDQACSCRRPGESWSQALKNVDDPTVEQGDIVVNDQRARQLSQPRVDAQGKPIRQAPLVARPGPIRERRNPRLQPQPLLQPQLRPRPRHRLQIRHLPRSHPSPIPIARSARSDRHSCRRADC